MGYDFTASLAQTRPAYGITVPLNAPISGQFILDSQAVRMSVPGSPNAAVYRHHIPEGFKATFGALDIRADEYLVTVWNNVMQPTGFLADTISIRWASSFNPPISPPLAPIHVNGVSQTTGMFTINLVGNQNLFSNTSLPTSLNISSFMSKLSFLGSAGNGSIDLVYNVNSLAGSEIHFELPPAVPEPNSFLSVFFTLLLGQWIFASRFASPRIAIPH